MDIGQIATTAVALLAPYLTKAGEAAAKKAGEAAWKKVEALYQAIERKFVADKDDDAQKTLQHLEDQPKDDGCQAALASVLAAKAAADPEFAQDLARLVHGAAQDKTVTQFLIQVYPEAEVNKIINIGKADVVQID